MLHDPDTLRPALHSVLQAGKMDIHRPGDGIAGLFHIIHEMNIDDRRLDIAVKGLFLVQQAGLLHIFDRNLPHTFRDDQFRLLEQVMPIPHGFLAAPQLSLCILQLVYLLLESRTHRAVDIPVLPGDKILHFIEFKTHLLVIFEYRHHEQFIMGIHAVIIVIMPQRRNQPDLVIITKRLLRHVAKPAHLADGILLLVHCTFLILTTII